MQTEPVEEATSEEPEVDPKKAAVAAAIARAKARKAQQADSTEAKEAEAPAEQTEDPKKAAVAAAIARAKARKAKQEEPAGLVWIHVDDNGPGLGDFSLSDLCEPFLTTKQNGLGLGLSISQQILASMNGRLCAQNREQGGARFSLRLPIAPNNTEQSKG